MITKSLQLMTPELEARFAEIGSQENSENPIVVAKYFNPVGQGTWYATEYDPITKIFFGYVSIFGDWNDEWGTFALSDLEDLKLPLGMKIERDLYCGEKTINEHLKK